ncbi:MAG: ABC transporter permease subunit [Rhodocyclaceae bacterium]|jgi:thiamine transport system permease protein|nr:ABC transporter permease subunit [Rhodocyclaceae bacterium]
MSVVRVLGRSCRPDAALSLPLAAPAWLAGGLALGLVSGLSVLAFLALAVRGDWSAAPVVLGEAWFWQVLRFSLWQALLSAVLAVGLALPVARAVALDPGLPARAAFLRLCLLCFVMPPLVLVTGLVVLLGRSGWLSPWLGEGWNLYGLAGIVIAHVYLNLPFALRVLCFRWRAIPDGAWKLAAQLGLSGWQRFRRVEWPALRSVLPGVFGFVFLLCFNSFAVVLALGGGPRATTLEVAIYQALKFDFNPSEALLLAGVQLLVAGGLFMMLLRWSNLQWLSASAGGHWRPQPGRWGLWAGRLAYALCALCLLLPLLVLLPTALGGRLGELDQFAALPWAALGAAGLRSLVLAGSAAALSLGLALACLSLWRQWPAGRRRVELLAQHQLVVPAMVLSVGVYVLLMPVVDWLRWGVLAVVVFNALVALPFVFQQLRPRVFDFEAQYRRLVADLGLGPWARWRRVSGPYLRPALRRAMAIALVLALGDVALFGVFGDAAAPTLPWMIHALAGAYRLADAALASLLLLLLALAALRLLEHDHA